jgi:hypothetical protein
MKESHYRHLIAMAALSFVAVYILMYAMVDTISDRVGGLRRLSDCSGRMVWPAQGVYFFFEDGELRSDSGTGLRVVRVGTHGLREGSTTTLWRRLAQHRGTRRNGGGNHRGSVFRLHLGTALAGRDKTLACPTSSGVRKGRDTPVLVQPYQAPGSSQGGFRVGEGGSSRT